MAKKEKYVITFWAGVAFTVDDGADPWEYVQENYDELLEQARGQLETNDDDLIFDGYVEE